LSIKKPNFFHGFQIRNLWTLMYDLMKDPMICKYYCTGDESDLS